MNMRALNDELLRPNECFGCGLDNQQGMQIRIYRDPANENGLTGTFSPRPHMGGFPMIVHGGLQFTALDCMAGWCTFILRGRMQPLMPLTRSASMRFLRPARLGTELTLRAAIVREGAAPKDGWSIQAAILDVDGNVLSEADLDYVLVPEDRFKKAVGIAEMPDSYRRHFGRT